jgi:hypothetical protein
MAKFYGTIGYASTTESETEPGVWEDKIIERSYTGDVISNLRRWQSNENVNPDLTITDTISIIADGFILDNVHAMKYVKWMNATWAVISIRVERPRVILEIGGLYSGPTIGSS